MSDLPDIPYAFPRQRIVNAIGNEFLLTATAQLWHSYSATSEITGLQDDCIAVEYSTGAVPVPGEADRTMTVRFAWNLATPRDILERQINYSIRQLGQFFFGQTDGRGSTHPIVWPNTEALSYSTDGIARGPLRHIRFVYVTVDNFSEWVPPMNYTP